MRPTALPVVLLIVLAAGCAGQQMATPPTTATAPAGALTPATAPGSTVSTVTPTTATPTTTAAKAGGALPDVHGVDYANMTLPGDSCGKGQDAPAGGIPLRGGRWNAAGSAYVEVTD